MASQLSSVHPLPSSQSGAGPPVQAPPAQVSCVVHASASLHASVLFAYVHPTVGSHASSVQTLPSLQFGGAPPIFDYKDMAYDRLDPNAVYSNPLPHVLILTAIVVGVATLSVGLALVVRIREAYGSIEDDTIAEADYSLELEKGV